MPGTFASVQRRTTRATVRGPGQQKAKPKTPAGVAGLPLYIRGRVRLRRRRGEADDPYEHHAARVADKAEDTALPMQAASEPSQATEAQRDRLPPAARAPAEAVLGADFSDVHIHDDSAAHQLAASAGANAVTSGNDVYFHDGAYDPASPQGRRIVAHELAHVAQQRGGAAPRTQFDLMESLPTALGVFELGMATRAAPRPGMEGTIRFLPDPTGPYSAQIGLVQVVNMTDTGGRTTPSSGSPVDWSNIGTGTEAGRQQLMTTGLDGAPPGWFIDSQTAAHAPGTNVGPNYIEQWGTHATNYFGFLRGPADWRETSLYDYPFASFDTDFEFETVAKATDTQTVYGALNWGFSIRSGAVTSEYAYALDAESSTFQEALERFRGYYTHEPVVIYFDTGDDIPMSGEEAKLAAFMDYLDRYPDVLLQIEGYADERGSIAENDALSLRRAQSVENLLLLLGVDPARIDFAVGWGETAMFAAGKSSGQLQANRRVVITFVRSASTPIVMP
jgi:outer membrane protein OmpA-like peptidoglycan-associated protein